MKKCAYFLYYYTIIIIIKCEFVRDKSMIFKCPMRLFDQ